MKTTDFAPHRSQVLRENLHKALSMKSVTTVRQAYEIAAELPAPRFWVSEGRAAEVISLMIRGKNPTESMHPQKRKMFQEIYRRYLLLRRENPDTPLCHLIFEVVNSPAPSSYISWHHLSHLI